jgi:hypothetical protein
MTSARDAGRIVGMLFLVHLVTGLILPYVLLRPLMIPPGGFLETAARMSDQVRLNVMLLFVGGAVTVGIAALVWPVVRQQSSALGLWLLVLAGANLSLQAVENSQWLSMLSLSQAYAEAGVAEAGTFRSLAIVVRSAWRWAHYAHLLVVVSWMFVLFMVLYRRRLVPRALATAGMVTAVLQLTGITLPGFLGYRMPFPMLFGMPLGVAYLALAFWLMARGFKEPVGAPGEGWR